MDQLNWVKLLRDKSSDLEAALPAAVDPGLLADALNLVPPPFTCPLLRVLDQDLERHFTSDATGELSQFEFSLDEETLRTAHGHIQTARDLLKDLSAFFRSYKNLQCICPECSAGSRASNKANKKKRL